MSRIIGGLFFFFHIKIAYKIKLYSIYLDMFFLSDELWNCLWENCSTEQAFVEALGDAAVRGELSNSPPSPDFTQVIN